MKIPFSGVTSLQVDNKKFNTNNNVKETKDQEEKGNYWLSYCLRTVGCDLWILYSFGISKQIRIKVSIINEHSNLL